VSSICSSVFIATVVSLGIKNDQLNFYECVCVVMDEDWIDIGTACIATDDTPDINEQIADDILDENEALNCSPISFFLPVRVPINSINS
jgi:hypothetical protein